MIGEYLIQTLPHFPTKDFTIFISVPKVEAPKPDVAQPTEGEGEGKQSRAERKTKKAMMKLGLAPVEGKA